MSKPVSKKTTHTFRNNLKLQVRVWCCENDKPQRVTQDFTLYGSQISVSPQRNQVSIPVSIIDLGVGFRLKLVAHEASLPCSKQLDMSLLPGHQIELEMDANANNCLLEVYYNFDDWDRIWIKMRPCSLHASPHQIELDYKATRIRKPDQPEDPSKGATTLAGIFALAQR